MAQDKRRARGRIKADADAAVAGVEAEVDEVELGEFELPDDYAPAGDDWFGDQPTKKAKHFWPSAKRLFGLLAPEKWLFSFITLLVVASVALTVIAPRVLGDACEAIIAAVYLDGGLEAARRFILRYWEPFFERAAKIDKDPKTALQEWLQARRRPVPRRRRRRARSRGCRCLPKG